MNSVEMMQDCFLQLDSDTISHSLRVGRLCELIGEEIGIDASLLYTIGVFHDIGKIYIPREILQKPSSLTDEERAIVDLHSTKGGEILRAILPKHYVIYFPVMFHHGFVADSTVLPEKEYDLLYDLWQHVVCADQYLKRLTSIVHMADIVDALTSKRAYHEPVSLEKAFAEMNTVDPLYDEEIKRAIEKKIIGLNTETSSIYDNGVNIIKLVQCISNLERKNTNA